MSFSFLSLSIDVGTVQLNALPDNPALWSLPVMSGYPQIDLGTAAPGSIAPMRSVGSSDWNTGASPAFVGLSPQTIQNAPNSVLSAVPSTAVLPPRPTPVPVALVPAQPEQPVTYQLQPGGVAIPLGVR